MRPTSEKCGISKSSAQEPDTLVNLIFRSPFCASLLFGWRGTAIESRDSKPHGSVLHEKGERLKKLKESKARQLSACIALATFTTADFFESAAEEREDLECDNFSGFVTT